ncbi:MAG: glycoside hydrolase family 127 protein [Chloroflexota bacterium]
MNARRVLSGAGLDAAVRPTPSAISRFAPIGARDIRVTGGFWGERLRTNRERTIPYGLEQLRLAGNLANLKLAAGAHGRYRALGESAGTIFPFLDTDVYKWLEAVGWELGRAPDRVLNDAADDVIALVERAQRDDGYLNSYVQVVAPGREYDDLAWGHELYSFGHLIQAAIAWQRAVGDDRLLRVATRAADAVDRELGPGGRDGIDGHPEVEMALVELYRATGERRYLELAARMIDLRGHGLLGIGRYGSAYWQDHAPVREARTVTGHAVRQLYLDCGAVDVATELGDGQLLEAVVRRWHDMMETRTYLTGGLGSRHRDEAFGDPYELPPDQAYAETCASIASVMLAWRLLLATGDPAHADAIERTAFNGVLPGLSLEGTDFFYVNALQRRTERVDEDERSGTRKPWFACACCPPNVMRFLSSWQQYLATTDAGGVQLHQFFTGELTAERASGSIRISTATGYPWDGAVTVTILETPVEPWTLSLRVPAWSGSATLRNGTTEAVTMLPRARMIEETRRWQAGDALTLELDTAVRAIDPGRYVDAVRGCVALERGPLVYCIETADLPAGTVLEDVELDPSGATAAVARRDLSPTAIGVTAAGLIRSETGDHREIELNAIPYFTWANRTVEAMRVWIPRPADES